MKTVTRKDNTGSYKKYINENAGAVIDAMKKCPHNMVSVDKRYK